MAYGNEISEFLNKYIFICFVVKIRFALSKDGAAIADMYQVTSISHNTVQPK